MRESPSESEDQLQRNTKKVKTRNDKGEFSYKDSLMQLTEFDGAETDVSEDKLPENKWYDDLGKILLLSA
ncbi:hypothetical protein SESBI_11555 [Sesbania bispinosa]|nr:hypothetical protein SESBI_11555 [Sesbania bispinosa]